MSAQRVLSRQTTSITLLKMIGALGTRQNMNAIGRVVLDLKLFLMKQSLPCVDPLLRRRITKHFVDWFLLSFPFSGLLIVIRQLL